MNKSSFFNRINGMKRYSLKTVSIVVVFVFMLSICLSACGSSDGTVAEGAGNETSVQEGTQSGATSPDGSEDDGQLSDGGADPMSGADGSDVDDNAEPEPPYGEYEAEVVCNFQWECSTDNNQMYVLTNPNLNASLRGALIDTDVSAVKGTSCVASVIFPFYLKAGDTISFEESYGFSRRYFYADLDREKCIYTCTEDSGWKDIEAETITVPYDTYVMIDYRFSDKSTEDITDVSRGIELGAESAMLLQNSLTIMRNASRSDYDSLYSDNNILLDEIEVTEGKSAEGNPYILIKIPSELSTGEQVMPELQQTSWMEYYAYPSYTPVSGTERITTFRSIVSPYMFAGIYHTALTINAGLFNIYSNTPQGQTIIDGRVITNNPMKDDIGDPISPNTECYAMTIDVGGMFDFAKHEDGSPYRTIDAELLLEQGAYDVITGWGCIVYDGKSVVELNPANVNASTIFYEQVHRKKVAHQVIGQDRAGNYYILSTNDVESGYGFGLYYDECAEIMLNAGATFAYMLDGGDSVSTIINGEMATVNYFEDFGKPVPTVISFVVTGD